MQPPFGFCAHSPTKETLTLNSGSAFCFFVGQGVPQDFAEAVRWFQKAPTRATLRLKIVSVSCTRAAKACRRTTRPHCVAFGLDGLVAGVPPLSCPPAVGHVARIVDGRNGVWSGSGSRHSPTPIALWGQGRCQAPPAPARSNCLAKSWKMFDREIDKGITSHGTCILGSFH
jgi:hypothetical protein